MRNELAPYLHQYVLCKGWINSYEDLEDAKRVCISQPTLRKPNKNVLFQNQEKIATVHHLNLFIKWEDLDDYHTEITPHSTLEFTGFVNHYTRSDGSQDYGIFPTKQSRLHYQLKLIGDVAYGIADKCPYSPEMLYYCKELALPGLNHCLEELERAGDYLPTFFHTYSEYKASLNEWIEAIQSISKVIETACQSRASRRLHKIKTNFSDNYEEIVGRRVIQKRLTKFHQSKKAKPTHKGFGVRQPHH